MAKYKRKPSARQRDKSLIEAAKKLKKKGILQKTTKLHGGKFISRGVVKRVEEFMGAANLGYTAYKAPKEIVKAAKERGFQTVGGTKIIGPPNSNTFRARLKAGLITGVRPVKGGMMEEVIMPHSVTDLYSLMEQIRGGVDSLKTPDEHFAFRFYGNESLRSFSDSEDMYNYLTKYQTIFNFNGTINAKYAQEVYQNLSIFRLHPDTIRQNIRTAQQRKQDRRNAMSPGGRNIKRRSQAERLALMNPQRANRIRKREAERAKQKRAAIAADPVKDAAYKERAKERARKSRERNKGK